MKKYIISLAAFLALTVGAGAAMFYGFPGKTLSLMQSGIAWNAGFERKTINVGGYTSHYYEAGPKDGKVVVLLHGLIDDKNSFVPAAAKLVRTHRVILPDLQGHGENAQLAKRDYSIRGQVNFIKQLLEELDIEDPVIGGNSMGGHVAAALALSNQQSFQKVILLNATGLLLDEPTTYFKYPDDIDVSYVTQMYDNVFVNPPSIPGPIMSYLAQDLKRKVPFYNSLIGQLIDGEDFRLDERIESLSLPTLVIWGAEDNVVPIKYGNAYHAKLPKSDFSVFPVGHAPQLEIPEKIGDEILAFVTKD